MHCVFAHLYVCREKQNRSIIRRMQSVDVESSIRILCILVSRHYGSTIRYVRVFVFSFAYIICIFAYFDSTYGNFQGHKCIHILRFYRAWSSWRLRAMSMAEEAVWTPRVSDDVLVFSFVISTMHTRWPVFRFRFCRCD